MRYYTKTTINQLTGYAYKAAALQRGGRVGARLAQVALEFEWMIDRTIELNRQRQFRGPPFCQGLQCYLFGSVAIKGRNSDVFRDKRLCYYKQRAIAEETRTYLRRVQGQTPA
jgi:hypothetical protein